ncbi:DUF3265 domain-containing protein, partial [Vibrio parahaemolyticus]|nr:DUF3265 domain-containing protein [Vibrio parahaemolyticus]
MEGCVSTVSESKRITICLRVIRNAWHFYYASD